MATYIPMAKYVTYMTEEKRPFFLQGNEIFDFGAGGTSGGRLFYSRRIGRAPTLAPDTPLSDVPTTTTIIGAGKLSGKVAGWSLGALTAVTARELPLHGARRRRGLPARMGQPESGGAQHGGQPPRPASHPTLSLAEPLDVREMVLRVPAVHRE